jgi:hypothetical protein
VTKGEFGAGNCELLRRAIAENFKNASIAVEALDGEVLLMREICCVTLDFVNKNYLI